MLDSLHDMLLKYVNDPSDPNLNYQIGREYERIGHTAAAISYLLRAAERTKDRLMAYECLIRIANCFDRQGNRPNTTRDMYRAAIAWMPERPEAYYLMAKKQENEGNNSESYMYASLGHEMEIKQKNLKDLDVGFIPEWGLPFTKTRSGWWIGKTNQTRRELQDLIDHYYKDMDKYHQDLLEQRVIYVGSGPANVVFTPYFKKDHENLRHKFPGSEKIERNYAQVYQDIFILSILNGKRNGTFLEVGGCDPYWGNNTATLEQDFSWRGVSIELNDKYAESYRNARPRTVLYNQDAITTDYKSLLRNHFEDKVIDYLQMDIDPPVNTFNCLRQIPFDEYKFRVITYEHDYSADMTREIRDKAREYLKSKGYLLVVDDVSPDGFWNFEDWWVHPDLVDPDLLKKMMCVTGKTKNIGNYILSKPNEEVIMMNSTKQDSKDIIIEAHQKYDSQLCWGWCSLDKSGAFVDYIDDVCSRVENPVCVEIGVFGGKSVLPVALELKRHNKGKLYAIDPWTSEEAGKGYENLGEQYTYWTNVDLQKMYEFFMNLLKEYDVENYVDVIKTTSDDAPIIEDIDFLYIDGQHTDQAHRDVMKFATRVKLDGYCVVDDVSWGEVKDVPNMLDALGFTHIHYLDTAYVYKRKNIVDFTKDETNIFKINTSLAKRAFVVDNFYKDPMAIREFAQRQEYVEGGLGRGFIGRRTVYQFLFPGIKQSFESIMQKKITAWKEHGMNGRFQLNIGGEQLVYHCDSQKYAAMIYLTPNAPPRCGTSTFMHKKTRVYHNSDPRLNEVFYGIKTTMDRTPYDKVDSFGNIFNRLVIFDAGCIHAATDYFGADMEDGRLWHMFFFDAE